MKTLGRVILNISESFAHVHFPRQVVGEVVKTMNLELFSDIAKSRLYFDWRLKTTFREAHNTIQKYHENMEHVYEKQEVGEVDLHYRDWSTLTLAQLPPMDQYPLIWYWCTTSFVGSTKLTVRNSHVDIAVIWDSCYNPCRRPHGAIG